MIAGSAVGSSMCQVRRGNKLGDIRLDHDLLILTTQSPGQARRHSSGSSNVVSPTRYLLRET